MPFRLEEPVTAIAKGGLDPLQAVQQDRKRFRLEAEAGAAGINPITLERRRQQVSQQSTDPVEVLREINDPLTRGIEKAQSEAEGGIQDAIAGTPQALLMGAVRALSAIPQGIGRAAGSATQNFLAGVPGLGGAGGIVPAVGGALVDAATQTLPVTGPFTAFRALNATRPVTATGRIAKASQALRRPADPIKRAVTGKKAVKDAFEKAEKVTKPVPTDDILDSFNKALTDVADQRIAQKIVELAPTTRTMPFNQVVKTQQEVSKLMKAVPRNDTVARAAVDKIRTSMVDASSKVDDALLNANKLAAHTAASDKVLGIVNSARTGKDALRRFDQLLITDKSLVGRLGGEKAVKLVRSAVKAGAKGDTIRTILQKTAKGAAIGAAVGLGGFGAARVIQ